MIKKAFVYPALLVAMTLPVTSCNKEGTSYETVLSSSAQVKNFAIKANTKVLPNLDKVFFTIDLENYRIFNADSLPYGTDVRKLVPTISVASSSAIEIIVSGAKLQSDTTFNYLANPGDTIDFSGNVILRVVSADQQTSRDYRVSLNVHKMKADSLYWNKTARRDLPTTLSNPTAQKSLTYRGEAYCLAQAGGSYTLAHADNPANDWAVSDVTFPFTPDVNSLAASTDALYILDTDGNLYSSPDGLAWTSCGVMWHSIIGGYMDAVVGVEKRDGTYRHARYPSTGNPGAVPDNFPVSGHSALVIYSTEWSNESQAIMTGGILADGTPTGATWGYDGKSWIEINRDGLPALSDMTLFPYFGYHTDPSAWIVTKASIWVAMGGRDASGRNSDKTYMSFDCGINWKLADELMQLPDYIPSFHNAQALVFDEMLHSRSGHSRWEATADRTLPVWWMVDMPSSRAVTPITEWECPYVYLFGGVSADGTLYPTVWRGVINRLTFQPLQ
ncbi:MAG: DUF6242 domain-containing protein [Pseudoflavonifractor sp.]|nr:DUF6242 domain-containing protein [Pseudoflavonifractor sp.]